MPFFTNPFGNLFDFDADGSTSDDEIVTGLGFLNELEKENDDETENDDDNDQNDDQ